MAGAVHLVNQQDTASNGSRGWVIAAWLDKAVFVCVAAVALCAPLSTKGAVNSFRAATVLWLILLSTRKRKLVAQPLALPLILFLVLTGISSALSVDPFLSWGRMRTVSLILLAIVAGQAIRSLRHLKILAFLLIGSCFLTVLYTGWQYTAGIGVRAVGNGPELNSLRRMGMVPGDIIRQVGRDTIRSPRDLLSRNSPQVPVEILLWRETPNALQPFRIRVDLGALKRSLQAPGVTLVRAHPPRAQAFFKHYFPFSEILVFIGLLTLGFVVCRPEDSKLQIALMIAFVGIAITLALTLTRISLLSLALGALLILVMGARGRIRRAGIAGFVLLALAGIYWVQRHRGAPESDPGTEYRLLMWRDSVGLIRAHPLLGVGLDSVAGDWQRWNLEAYRRFQLHSHFHSTLVQLAVECGLPAVCVWLWVLAGLAAYLIRSYKARAASDWFSRGLLLGTSGALLGFAITGIVQYNFGDAEAMVVFWLLVGMTFAVTRLQPSLGASSEAAS